MIDLLETKNADGKIQKIKDILQDMVESGRINQDVLADLTALVDSAVSLEVYSWPGKMLGAEYEIVICAGIKHSTIEHGDDIYDICAPPGMTGRWDGGYPEFWAPVSSRSGEFYAYWFEDGGPPICADRIEAYKYPERGQSECLQK